MYLSPSRCYAADRSGWLRSFYLQLQPLDSPPAHARLQPGGPLWVLTMGLMDPSEEARGRLWRLNADAPGANPDTATGLSGLQRPVYFLREDLNADKRPDILAWMGQGREGLLAFVNKGNAFFRKKACLPFRPCMSLPMPAGPIWMPTATLTC